MIGADVIGANFDFTSCFVLQTALYRFLGSKLVLWFLERWFDEIRTLPRI